MPPTKLTAADLDTIAGGLAPFNRRLLLTGAGFSKPWGGYLSAELWSIIASHPEVRSRIELNRILHDDFNFEVILDRVERVDRATFTDEDRRILRAAVDQAFKLQEERIAKDHLQQARVVTLSNIVRTFKNVLTPSTTCLFTLNQDLLMERLFRLQPDVAIPGIVNPSALETGIVSIDRKALGSIKGQAAYIKLHGSMNWRDEGSGVSVLGGSKLEAIERFDILRMNSWIFSKAVTQPGARLLVIGYGFADPHINEMIAVGVRQGLMLWILDPREPKAIRQQLQDVRSSTLIWQSVVGHSTCSVSELFDSSTVENKLLLERFFQA